MNNLRFLRTQAGLTLEKLADIAGITPSLISKYEREERKLSEKSVLPFVRIFGASSRFILGESEKDVFLSHIICSDSESGETRFLSKADYIRYKRLGRIKEEIVLPEKISDQEAKEWREKSLDWEEQKAFWEMPVIRRTLKAGALEKADEKTLSMMEEAIGLIQHMNEEQLAKALLVIKEVILK